MISLNNLLGKYIKVIQKSPDNKQTCFLKVNTIETYADSYISIYGEIIYVTKIQAINIYKINYLNFQKIKLEYSCLKTKSHVQEITKDEFEF